jgi:hypothetical protein
VKSTFHLLPIDFRTITTDVHYLKTDLIDKSAVERLIVEHGGTFIQRIVRQDEGEYRGRIVVATDDKGCTLSDFIYQSI